MNEADVMYDAWVTIEFAAGVMGVDSERIALVRNAVQYYIDSVYTI